MKSIGKVQHGASRDDCLDAFNTMVRIRFPKALRASLGVVGCSYLQAVAIFMCTDFAKATDFRLGQHPWDDDLNQYYDLFRFRVCFAIADSTFMLGVFPLICAGLMTLGRLCLHLHGWREALYLGSGTLAIAGATIALDFPYKAFVHVAARGSDLALMTIVLLEVIITGLAFYCFKRRRFLWNQDEEEESFGREDSQRSWSNQGSRSIRKLLFSEKSSSNHTAASEDPTEKM